MENKIVTMANSKFGTVRKIYEGDRVIFCGADVAKALGYTNSRKALADHCKGVTKRYTPTKSGNQQMSFIPEADVYCLICHSKLPSALEFEKWVFEDVVPKAVNEKLPTKAKQPALETSEYHYFPKTFKGEPVITVADFAHFTQISNWTPYKVLKKVCVHGKDWLALSSVEMSQFKRENPSISRNLSYVYVIKASGVRKLLKYFRLSVEIPMIEEKKPVPTARTTQFVAPSEEMEKCMEHIRREARAIEGVANLLLCADLPENFRTYRQLLVWRIGDLHDLCDDIDRVKI